MASLIGLGILLPYLLRRYRNYILQRGRRDTITAAPREVARTDLDHSYRRTLAAAQELEAATLTTIKKEPMTPNSCHCTLAAAQELHHVQAAIKKEPVSPCSCRRTLSMPVISLICLNASKTVWKFQAKKKHFDAWGNMISWKNETMVEKIKNGMQVCLKHLRPFSIVIYFLFVKQLSQRWWGQSIE